MLVEQTVKGIQVGLNTESVLTNREIVCMTPECVRSASKLLEYMDPNVDPCDDFYNFACGSFMKNTVIPSSKSSISTISFAQDDILLKLKKIMDSDADADEDVFLRMLKIFYRSCMDKVSIEKQGIQPLRRLLETLGGWPVIEDNWDESNFSWIDFTWKNKKVGLPIDYFPVPLILKSINKTSNVTDFRRPAVAVHRNLIYVPNNQHEKSFEIEEARLLKAYHNYMVDVAVSFGADRDRAMVELQEALDFEYDLTVKISLPMGISDLKSELTQHRNWTTLKELTNKYPSIPWMEHAQKFLQIRPEEELNENYTVEIASPILFDQFAELLNKTPKRVLANYAIWRLIYDMIDHVGGKIQDVKLKYLRESLGIMEHPHRWEQCIDVIIDKLPGLVDLLYENKYPGNLTRDSVTKIINRIRAQFEKTVEKLDWLSDEARNTAFEKLESMCTLYNVPNKPNLSGLKPELYTQITEFMTDNYFENILKLASAGLFNQRPWLMSSVEVNAYAWQFSNCIELPIGILHETFFKEERPNYMNYAEIGYVIAHEISHGFDNKGVNYDQNGTISNWLRNDSRKEFMKRSQCIVEQYGNFTDDEVQLTLDGVNVLNENIADNSGQKWAYFAYEDWALQNGSEFLLPGVNFTQEQIFWISMAQTECQKYRPGSLRSRIISDVHSPAHFRVIGAMSNLAEFSRDFECPIGSRMNPEVKCTVW
ncbi:hypothetical protein QAD02_010178 [Eretmocerus hayati]|uniref:Uncharacterized protein n=1 Tax=Eretmocerus hayati TaxID=131215 RepID=A0ACC2NBI1_9HYME|nr:hypothetical protein QAD02_010178 [Eretmocerus hayati]